MRKSVLFVGACALAFQSVAMAQEPNPVDFAVDNYRAPVQVDDTEVKAVLNDLQATEQATEVQAAENFDVRQLEGGDTLSAENAEFLNQYVKSQAAAAQSDATPVAKMLAKARQDGLIKADGTFVVDDKEVKASGKLLCSDAALEKHFSVLENATKSADFNEAQVQNELNQTMKCVSISHFEAIDEKATVVFDGQFDYPTFKDGSTFKVMVQGKEVANVRFGLDGVQQTFDMKVWTDKGEKLGILKTQYDTQKIGKLMELTAVAGLVAYTNRNSANADQIIEDRLQALLANNVAELYNAAHLLQLDIYRENEKPLLLVRGDVNDNVDAKLFNSAERSFVASNWNGTDFNLKVDFPKTDMPFVNVAVKTPADFREKYKAFTIKMMNGGAQSQPPVAELGRLASGITENVVLYGMNKKPLATLAVRTNDAIQLSLEKQPKAEDIIQSAELKIMKDDATCPIKSISFDKNKPTVLTVCDTAGCHDEVTDTIAQSTVPTSLLSCLGEVPMMAQQYKNEATEEFKKLQSMTAILAGFGMIGAGAGVAGAGVASVGGVAGYNMAMNRYNANELINQASMVAIMAMSKNAGEGGNADLSDLGGVSEEMKKIVNLPTDISSTKDGIVTIRVKPEVAQTVLPMVGQIAAKKVISGCTAADTSCVLDITKQN